LEREKEEGGKERGGRKGGREREGGREKENEIGDCKRKSFFSHKLTSKQKKKKSNSALWLLI